MNTINFYPIKELTEKMGLSTDTMRLTPTKLKIIRESLNNSQCYHYPPKLDASYRSQGITPITFRPLLLPKFQPKTQSNYIYLIEDDSNLLIPKINYTTDGNYDKKSQNSLDNVLLTTIMNLITEAFRKIHNLNNDRVASLANDYWKNELNNVLFLHGVYCDIETINQDTLQYAILYHEQVHIFVPIYVTQCKNTVAKMYPDLNLSKYKTLSKMMDYSKETHYYINSLHSKQLRKNFLLSDLYFDKDIRVDDVDLLNAIFSTKELF